MFTQNSDCFTVTKIDGMCNLSDPRDGVVDLPTPFEQVRLLGELLMGHAVFSENLPLFRPD